jgi:hypothetical protein
MSFGGGGSGAAPITAHVHNNNAGEGGDLKMVNGANTTKFDIGVGGNQQIPLEAVL